MVHDSTDKIACGIIEPTSGLVASIGAYPDYTTNGYNISGTILVTSTDSGINITGTLGGLEASVSGGFHVHSGFTCDDADGVGGHYFEGMSSDPWDSMYTSDSNGYAEVDIFRSGFTLDEAYPVAYRALVAHLSTGSSQTRAGCGLIGTADLAVAKLDTYPGYTGSYTVTGTVAVTTNGTGVMLVGTLTGVPASTTAGIHIHTGVSCAASSDPGGHYYPGMTSDPWSSTTYTSDENGVASVSFSVDDFSLGGSNPVAGRVIVVHDSTDKIACGIIEPSTGKTATCLLPCCVDFVSLTFPWPFPCRQSGYTLFLPRV